MIQTYSYELWDGKRVVGQFFTSTRLMGASVTVPETPLYRWRYAKHWPTIEVPIIWQQVSDDGVAIVMKRMLDVRRKSKRQINILKGAHE